MLPSGNERVRTFLPSKEFDVSRAFYETLGFEVMFEDDDVAAFKVGQSSFLLQRYYQREWAENFMMQLLVDDLDAWWEHLSSLDLPGRFNIPEPKPPELQSWGLVVAFVVDPSGVLWHVVHEPT